MPAEPLSGLVMRFVLTLRMETFAPATTAPVGSVTTPVTVPRSTCPQPGAVKSVPIKTARQNLWKNMHTSANAAEIRSLVLTGFGFRYCHQPLRLSRMCPCRLGPGRTLASDSVEATQIKFHQA